MLPTRFVTIDFTVEHERFSAVVPEDKVQIFNTAIFKLTTRSIKFSFLEKFLLQCNGFLKN